MPPITSVAGDARGWTVHTYTFTGPLWSSFAQVLDVVDDDTALRTLNRGASPSEVQDVLGHASPASTKRVSAHSTPHVLRGAFEKDSAGAAELVAELEAEQERRRRVG